MNRLAKLDPVGLDPAQRELYDAIVGGPRARGPQRFALVDDAGRLEGPFNAMLLSPPAGSALQALGSAIRYRSHLTDRAREIATLVVARHESSEFEAHAHEALARAAGLTEAELTALRAGQESALAVFDDAHESVVARTAWALCRHGDLDETEYRTARAAIGPAGLFELTTLIGYYRLLATQLRVFRVTAPSSSG